MEVCKDCDNKKESHEESDSDEYTTAILNGNPTDVSRDLSHYYTKYEDCSSSDDEVDSDEEGEDWEAKIKSREIRSNGDDTEIGSSDLDDIQQLEVTDSSENYIEADDFGDFQSSEQPETYSLSHSQYLEWNQASSSSDEELEMEIDPSTCKEPSVSAGNSSESRRIRLPPLSPEKISKIKSIMAGIHLTARPDLEFLLDQAIKSKSMRVGDEISFTSIETTSQI